MSGLPCQILHSAIVTVSQTDPAFDGQMRRFFSSDEVAQSVTNVGSGTQLCGILEKAAFSNSDRAKLSDIAQSLWAPGYT
jgi:hypothetical protein